MQKSEMVSTLRHKLWLFVFKYYPFTFMKQRLLDKISPPIPEVEATVKSIINSHLRTETWLKDIAITHPELSAQFTPERMQQIPQGMLLVSDAVATLENSFTLDQLQAFFTKYSVNDAAFIAIISTYGRVYFILDEFGYMDAQTHMPRADLTAEDFRNFDFHFYRKLATGLTSAAPGRWEYEALIEEIASFDETH